MRVGNPEKKELQLKVRKQTKFVLSQKVKTKTTLDFLAHFNNHYANLAESDSVL